MVSFIISKAFQSPLSNLLSLLDKKDNEISLVCSSIEQIDSSFKNKHVKWMEIPFKKPTNIILYGLLYIILQLRICFYILKQEKNQECFLFFMEGVGLFPMVLVKILNKPLIWMLPSSILMARSSSKTIFFHFMKYLQSFSAQLSTVIILYSQNLIGEWNLDRFRNKVHIAHEHFLDFSKFKIFKRYENRAQIIGYIGRLSDEKGTLDFLKAIPIIIKDNKDVTFFIGGDGILSEKVTTFIEQNELQEKVTYNGWISRTDLPEILNDLKLLVIPSKTEGLPNMMIESMACGTPVLATSVGSIPDIIKDQDTGFILSNIAPEQIKKDINRALNHPELDQISKRSSDFISQHFNQRQTVNMFRQILTSLNNKNKKD